MFRRIGFTYRIYDIGPITVACASNWICDGSHRWPKIDFILRDRWFAGTSCTGKGRAVAYRRCAVPLPYIRWYTAFKHPVLRPIQRRFDRLYRRLFRAP